MTFRQIAEVLRTEAKSMQSGDPFPTMQEVRLRFGVSRNVIVKAVKVLRDEGLIESRGEGFQRRLYVR